MGGVDGGAIIRATITTVVDAIDAGLDINTYFWNTAIVEVYDFQPEVQLPHTDSYLDVVEHTRLLGIQISTDLKWAKQTKFLQDRANSKLWMLRRMKILNIDPDIIVDFYFKEIRSICEMACQVFHSGLTKNQSKDIEKIQKRALKLILGNQFSCST